MVVFAGKLTVRGNATMIDHGWGVYSAYMHQSEILVKPGDRVEAGQLIGRVGRTGLRITGPHLHFEMWAGGVQIDPMDWLTQEYP
jgi:murein DD-endopeptidase MepM/ murein hydrolase activator NlpD